MAPQSSSQRFRSALLIILPILSAVGVYGTWVLGTSNGTFEGITEVLKSKSPVLPYSKDAMLRTYTGIDAIDSQLQVLVTFFAPVVNGANPALSLYSWAGFGQFGVAWTLLVLEGMRPGNSGKAVSFVGMTGLIFQNLAFTVTVPLYLMLHLLTSPVATSQSGSVFFVRSKDLKLVLVSVTLGFIVPTFLMLLPSPATVTAETHQRLIAFWQAFPLWTVATHTLLRSTTGGSLKDDSSKKPLAPYLRLANYVYGSLVVFSTITFIPVLAITLLPKDLLPGALAFDASFADVFVPILPVLSYKAKDLAEGALIFLHWDLYVGSTAVILWASLLYRNAIEKASISSLISKITTWTLVSGPMGAATMILWERDAAVAQKVKQGE